MAYKTKTMTADQKNFGRVRPYSDIKYIIIHYTANDGDTAESNARYFQREHMPPSSAHDFVDDKCVAHSVPYNFVAYSAGGSKYSDCRKTGGGKLYGVVTNANSISIELCGTANDGTCRAGEKTLRNAAALCRELMKRYNIDSDHVVRHFDVTGKHCPAYFMDEAAWEAFKCRLCPHSFKTGNSYLTTRTCNLRKEPDFGSAKVQYCELSGTLKKKCVDIRGVAKMKQGVRFRLVAARIVKNNLWGRIQSGFWVPLVYNNEVRAEKIG